MLSWLILGGVLLAAALLVARSFVKADPAMVAGGIRRSAALLFGLMALVSLLAGKFAFAVPLALVAFGFLGRGNLNLGGLNFGGFRPSGAWFSGAKPSPGNVSEMKTFYLIMTLEHDTGVLEGTVLRGPFRDRKLSELSFPELLDLLFECRAGDGEAAILLETYLDRTQGAEWRQKPGAAGAYASPPTSGGQVTVEEAYGILGLAPGASLEDIKAAHKRLMKAMHPDQGGSTYIAAKINLAKEVLTRPHG